jgi:WD40 repeat protein
LVKLWNLSETRSHAEARYATSFQCGREINSVVPLRRSAAVWISSRDGAEIRDLNTGQRLTVIPSALGRIALSPDEKILVSAERHGRVKFWETATGREVTNHLAHAKGSDLPALAFSPDGRMLATAGITDSEVKLWSLEQGVPLAEPSLLKFPVGPVAISPDSKKLAAITRRGRAVIVDLQTRQVERDISVGDSDSLNFAAEFSPDGKLLVVAGNSGVAQIWNVRTGKLHVKLQGHTVRVSVATFSPDGSTLATAADDQTVRLWDVVTGQERVSFNRHLHQVRSLAFTPDGNTLVSGDREGTVWVLRRPPIKFTEVRSGPPAPKR